MRLLALSALAGLVVVAWLRRPQPEPDRAMDDVQGPDPMTLGPGTYRWVPDDLGRLGPPTVYPTVTPRYGTGDFPEWDRYRITSSPRDWSYTDAITDHAIQSTQTGPLGPTA